MPHRVLRLLRIAWVLPVLPIFFLAMTSCRIVARPESSGMREWHEEILGNPSEFGLEIEPFEFQGVDGVTLHAYRATAHSSPAKATKQNRMRNRLGADAHQAGQPHRGTLVLLHGRSGCKEDLLPMCERFTAAGFACLVWDGRGHGASGGDYVTFGVLEKDDFVHFLDAATERFGDLGQISVFGHSLGGAIALQALETDSRIEALVTVNTFADLRQLIHEQAKARLSSVLGWAARPALWLSSIRSGVDLSSVRPVDALSGQEVPCLFIAGEEDHYILAQHSKDLASAAGKSATLHLVPEAGHHDIYLQGGDDLYEMICRFLIAATEGR